MNTDTSKTFACPPGASARVSVINNCLLKAVPTTPYIAPLVPGHDRFNDLPSYVFLIENSQGRKALFDFGLRKDWQNLSPAALSEIEYDRIEIDMQEDVLDILSRGGVDAEDIAIAVLSHHHFDHVGDCSLIPDTAKILVGSGFLKEYLEENSPDQVFNPSLPITHGALKGKQIEEISFSSSSALNIGPFSAVDVFEDGSFYILDAPGHTHGHICGLVRTTVKPDTFILMGADACHHNGEYRPSVHRPLPASSREPSISCLLNHQRLNMAKLQSHLQSVGRTERSSFFSINEDPQHLVYTHDPMAAKRTVTKVQELDQYDNVLVILAHDDSLLPIMDLFPSTINHWKQKEWDKKSQWAFLLDFKSLQ